MSSIFSFAFIRSLTKGRKRGEEKMYSMMFAFFMGEISYRDLLIQKGSFKRAANDTKKWPSLSVNKKSVLFWIESLFIRLKETFCCSVVLQELWVLFPTSLFIPADTEPNGPLSPPREISSQYPQPSIQDDLFSSDSTTPDIAQAAANPLFINDHVLLLL